MSRIGVRISGVGMVLGALLAPMTAQAFSVNDFTLTNAEGLSPVAYFAFTPITNNGDLDNIDLGLAVSFGNIDGTDRMFFEFVNESSNPNHLSSVKSIYLGSTLLSGSGAYVDGTDPGVSFSINPGNGNKGMPFSINHALDAVADSPAPTTGINPGESLLLGYAILGVDTAANAQLALDGLTNGNWGIGLHLIATDNGAESEKFVATFLPDGPQDPNTPVPEPATVVLLGIGASFLAVRKRWQA